MRGVRVAIVHDKLVQMGGAERVARELVRIWPQADLYTSAYDPLLAAREGFGQVHATFLQKLPIGPERTRWLLPLYDRAFRSLDLSGYDLVVSSSAMFAKSAHADGVPHVCYCHTPIRYLWDLRESHMRGASLSPPGPRRRPRGSFPGCGAVDCRAAADVDVFVANSNAVAERISQVYGRPAQVVHHRWTRRRSCATSPASDYLLWSLGSIPTSASTWRSRHATGWSRPSRSPATAAIASAWRQSRQHDRVPRTGSEDGSPSSSAGPGVLSPQVEDFGIVMVEALAAGTPVVALNAGGALDIVADGETGILFEDSARRTWPRDPPARPRGFDRETLRERACGSAASASGRGCGVVERRSPAASADPCCAK